MIATYDWDHDVPVWKEEEIIDGVRRATWWRVRLWTGAIERYETESAARAAYWR